MFPEIREEIDPRRKCCQEICPRAWSIENNIVAPCSSQKTKQYIYLQQTETPATEKLFYFALFLLVFRPRVKRVISITTLKVKFLDSRNVRPT